MEVEGGIENDIQIEIDIVRRLFSREASAWMVCDEGISKSGSWC